MAEGEVNLGKVFSYTRMNLEPQSPCGKLAVWLQVHTWQVEIGEALASELTCLVRWDWADKMASQVKDICCQVW